MSMTFEQRLADCEGFLLHQAKEWQRRNPTLCLDDLMQEGRLAVLEMHTRYDPSHGTKFLSFAGLNIRQRMRSHAVAFRDSLRGPVRNLGGLDMIALDAPLTDEGATLVKALAAPSTPDLWSLDPEVMHMLRQAMESLTAREQSTIDARFIRGLTLDQVATEMQSSRTRVHHRLTRALAKLRRAITPHL